MGLKLKGVVMASDHVELVSYKELLDENQRLKKCMQKSIDISVENNNPYDGMNEIVEDMIDNDWGFPEGTPDSEDEE